jgi:cytochrome P450
MESLRIEPPVTFSTYC